MDDYRRAANWNVVADSEDAADEGTLWMMVQNVHNRWLYNG